MHMHELTTEYNCRKHLIRVIKTGECLYDHCTVLCQELMECKRHRAHLHHPIKIKEFRDRALRKYLEKYGEAELFEELL